MSNADKTDISALLAQTDGWPADRVSVAIIDGEHTHTHGDQQRIYPLASVSKLVTATAVLMAVEEGAFGLDDHVPAELAPDFDTTPTIRDLLAHASGMAFDERSPQKAPHTRRIYSSAGFEVLADMIERTTEINFAEYVQLGICEPLGINITVEGSAGHGFSASASDLIALAQEFVRPRLLSEQTFATAFDTAYPDLPGIVPGYGWFNPCPWGLGFEIHGEKTPHWLAENMPSTIIGHFGQAGTFLWASPETSQAAVVLTDKPFGDWAKPRWQEFNEALWDTLSR